MNSDFRFRCLSISFILNATEFDFKVLHVLEYVILYISYFLIFLKNFYTQVIVAQDILWYSAIG